MSTGKIALLIGFYLWSCEKRLEKRSKCKYKSHPAEARLISIQKCPVAVCGQDHNAETRPEWTLDLLLEEGACSPPGVFHLDD